MSDAIATDFLSKLSTKRGFSSRSDETRDDGADSASKGRFDGLLQSYLARKDRTMNAATGKKGALLFDPLGGAYGGKDKFDKEKDAIREQAEERDDAMEDRYEDDPYASGFAQYFALLSEDGPFDAAMAEAADEAARIIVDLWQTDGGSGAGGSALGLPDGRFSGGAGGGSLAGMGAGGIDASSMAAALESSNASAEMNGAAVLAELEELLSGMPKNALEQALGKLAGTNGAEETVNAMLAALNGSVTGTGEEAAAAALMARLGLQDFASGRIVSGTAENSSETDIDSLTAKYLEADSRKESVRASLARGDRAAVAEGVREWMNANGISFSNKMLGGESASLSRLAGTGNQGSGPAAGNGNLSDFIKNMETMLQNNSGENTGEGADSPTVAGMDNPVLNGSGSAAISSKPPLEHRSAMLEQMGNIERIAEIMRHNNRQGVQHLTMQLSPPELGRVMIRVENRGGKLSALFRVGEAESAAQLQNNLQQLKDNLRARGIDLGEVHVQEDPTLSADSDGGRGGRDRTEPGAATGRVESRPGNDGENSGAAAEASLFDDDGRLNLFA